ncbi:MAG: hypothetical protein ACQEXG_15920 [Pseudomonadota bacterium]
MSDPRKLHVAPPRAAQPATFPEASSAGRATSDATGGLKALASAFLGWKTFNTTCNEAPISPPESMQPSALEKVEKVAPSRSIAPARDPPGPAHDIDTIIDVLVRQVGRPLGEDLERLMGQAMRPMSRIRRADLAAKIDDCFEYADSAQEGRQQVEKLV